MVSSSSKQKEKQQEEQRDRDRDRGGEPYKTPPSSTGTIVTGLLSPSPSPVRFQIPLPPAQAHKILNARGGGERIKFSRGLGMVGVPEEEGQGDEDVIGEEEDEQLLRMRRSMGRETVSASLPNIFQTPTKSSSLFSTNAFPSYPSPRNSRTKNPAAAPPSCGLGLSSTNRTSSADVFSNASNKTVSPNDTWPTSPSKDQHASFQVHLLSLPRRQRTRVQQKEEEEREWRELVGLGGEMPTSAPGSITHFPTSPNTSPTFHLTPPAALSTQPPQHQYQKPHRSHPPPPLRPIASYPLPVTPTPIRGRSTLLSPTDIATPQTPGFQDARWYSNSSMGGGGGGGGSISPGGFQVGELEGAAVEESRFVLVWELPVGVEVGVLKEVFLGMGDLRAILVKFLPSHGAIILAFHDLRHAISTSRTLQRKTIDRIGPDVKLRTSFVAKTTVEQLVGDTKQGMQLVGENDGGVMVTMLETQGGKLSLLGLQATLGAFGELRSFRVVGTQSRAFLAEFFDTRAASNAKKALHNRRVEETLLHVTFHCAIVSAPIFDSPITPTRRSDHEALYKHLTSIVANETSSLTKSQPQNDALNGHEPAVGGPFDSASLGRRGSTTGSFLPSALFYSAQSLVRALPSLGGIPWNAESTLGEEDKEEETHITNYLASGRRSSNFVGFDKSSASLNKPKFNFPPPSASSSTFSTAATSGYPSSSNSNSNLLRALSVPSPYRQSYSAAPTTPGPFTARSWMTLQTQDQPAIPGSSFSFQTVQGTPSTPAALLSFFAQGQREVERTGDIELISSAVGYPFGSSFGPGGGRKGRQQQQQQPYQAGLVGGGRGGGGAHLVQQQQHQHQQQVQVGGFDASTRNRRRFETHHPGMPGGGGGPDDQAILPVHARGVLSVSRVDEVPEANRVRLDRISQRLEYRTTVMIKDIPNKLSRAALISILDSVVPLGYDFVYLRMDFQNRCNVGYAFVNFSSVEALWTFAAYKMNTKWMIFSSEKVLQLSFANVQGKDALMNKFRNSAVMLQEDAYQPVLFYTDGPSQGRRQPFPPPTDPVRRENSLRSTQTSGPLHRQPVYHHLHPHPAPLTRSISNPGYSSGDGAFF
ncbi:hypothetical protein BDY24DRAFT_48422 [Mrakia frigida]|uniref:uncharacterized protein n=1 Tax=Mrakia frigida TaxID=29902 RepID=UPI003FCBF8B6